jgi:hypothetical protein
VLNPLIIPKILNSSHLGPIFIKIIDIFKVTQTKIEIRVAIRVILILILAGKKC